MTVSSINSIQLFVVHLTTFRGAQIFVHNWRLAVRPFILWSALSSRPFPVLHTLCSVHELINALNHCAVFKTKLSDWFVVRCVHCTGEREREREKGRWEREMKVKKKFSRINNRVFYVCNLMTLYFSKLLVPLCFLSLCAHSIKKNYHVYASLCT